MCKKIFIYWFYLVFIYKKKQTKHAVHDFREGLREAQNSKRFKLSKSTARTKNINFYAKITKWRMLKKLQSKNKVFFLIFR